MARKITPSFDAIHGLYHRTIGITTEGHKPKMWLGSNEAQAQVRAERLELLWSQVEKDWATLPFQYPNWLETTIVNKPDRPLWDEVTLAVARSISKGKMAFALPRKPSWNPYQYTLRVADLQRRFTAVSFVPEADEGEYHKIGAEMMGLEAKAEIRAGQDKLAAIAGQIGEQTLHQAFQAYIDHLSKLPDKSGWYQTQIKQTKRLIENHPDMLMTQLNLNQVEKMIDFWRHRPTIKEKIIAATTARNEIIQLDMILKWLDRNDQFRWQRPRLMQDLKRTIKDDDYRPPQVITFTLEELTTLYIYASPLVRLEMLLALNCGFKFAEIASLVFGEIHVGKSYPGIVRHNRPKGMGDWIVRFRRKTKVYGEWKLWRETAAAIEWAKANRKRPASTKSDPLLVTRNGLAFDEKTRSGNKSDKMAKSWVHLLTVVPQGKVTRLSFKHLEKTATDWIRNEYGGEVASLFSSHGKPVKSDAQLEAYSNKPYGTLFTALDKLHEYLAPMFAAVSKSLYDPATYTGRND